MEQGLLLAVFAVRVWGVLSQQKDLCSALFLPWGRGEAAVHLSTTVVCRAARRGSRSGVSTQTAFPRTPVSLCARPAEHGGCMRPSAAAEGVVGLLLLAKEVRPAQAKALGCCHPWQLLEK